MVKIVVCCKVCDDSAVQEMKIPHNLEIDPILRKQLENGVEPSKSVSAVVKLKPGDPAKATLPPEKIRDMTEAVLAKARERSGQTEEDYFVLDALGAFNLVAPAGFLIEVLNQPEVASAFSAETGEPERLLESKTSRSRVH
jgi:hypothetical protein